MIIEDVLRMYVMDRPSKWEDYLYLVEFAYNNGYQASLNMSSFEVLYHRKCNTLMSWNNPTYKAVIGIEFLREMKDQIVKIMQNLKFIQHSQKSFANKNRTYMELKVGEHVFLKVNEKMSLLILGSFSMLAVRYCGSFEFLEKIGIVAYILALSASMRIHNMFHVSLLKKYVTDPNHVIDCIVIQVEHEGDFRVEPVRILDPKIKVLRNKSIDPVKV
jgi:hypothetical protein